MANNLSKQIKITPSAHNQLLRAKAEHPDPNVRFAEVIEDMAREYLRGEN